MVSVPKDDCDGFFMFFVRNPLRPIPNPSACPPNPGVKEPKSASILLNLLQKMMQKVNSSDGMTKMDKGMKEMVTLRSSLKVVV
jgi:hypothetical protein